MSSWKNLPPAFAAAGLDPEALRVVSYHGTEGLSQLYRFEIDLAAEQPAAKLPEMAGQSAVFSFAVEGGQRIFRGVISRFEYIGEQADFRYYRAELVTPLWLLTQRYNSRIFQQKSTVEIVQMVLYRAGLLSDSLNFSARLIADYPQRDYCVQYRETDFNFISRLLEEDGIAYHFEQDKKECQLVLTDSPFFQPLEREKHQLEFVPPSGQHSDNPHVFKLHYSEELRVGKVTLNDYNFQHPGLDLRCESAAHSHRGLQVVDYPGGYQGQIAGWRAAAIRAEELVSQSYTASGSSNCGRLAAGTTFALAHHPVSACNQEYMVTRVAHRGSAPEARRAGLGGLAGGSAGIGGFLGGSDAVKQLRTAASHADGAIRSLADGMSRLIERLADAGGSKRILNLSTLHGGQVVTDPAALIAVRGGEPARWWQALATVGRQDANHSHGADVLYECDFECIPFGKIYRPPRVTPRPLMRGSQTARVVGGVLANGKPEEIHTDKHGRVKVHFHWDLEGPQDDHASCWIRVSQPWAGADYGGMAIPRVGQEVVVDFLEGDPDRPLIVGRVYNNDQKAPQSMPEPTRMTGKGPEPIPAMQGRPQSLPAAKTRTSIKSNSTPGGGGANEITLEDHKGAELLFVNATKDSVRTVGNDDTTTVGNDRKISISNNLQEFVASHRERHVGEDETVTVKGDRSMTVDGNEIHTVQMCRAQQVMISENVLTGISKTVQTGLAHVETVGMLHALMVGLKRVGIVGYSDTEIIGGDKTDRVFGDHSHWSGKTLTLKQDKDFIVEAAENAGIKSDKMIVVECPDITLKSKGGFIRINADGITIKGTKVKINCAGAAAGSLPAFNSGVAAAAGGASAGGGAAGSSGAGSEGGAAGAGVGGFGAGAGGAGIPGLGDILKNIPGLDPSLAGILNSMANGQMPDFNQMLSAVKGLIPEKYRGYFDAFQDAMNQYNKAPTLAGGTPAGFPTGLPFFDDPADGSVTAAPSANGDDPSTNEILIAAHEQSDGSQAINASAFDANAAAAHATNNAKKEPGKECATYVRESIEAGGITLKRTVSAKDYGPSLSQAGFQTVPAEERTYIPQKGDVVIFQPCTGHPDGHMQIYDGKQFVSDFKQKDRLWPNSDPTSKWKTEKPSFQVYRHP